MEPGENAHRTVASALYGKGPWSAGAIFARQAKHHGTTDAFTLEGAYQVRAGSLFARYENVAKDELIGVPDGVYRIGKFTVGGVPNLVTDRGYELGLGAYAGVSFVPSALRPFYGDAPVTAGIFLRLRPGRMR